MTPTDPISTKARALQQRAHARIPGGAHTYAKGDDQYPQVAPPLLVSGSGARVTDVDGRSYIEYGGGMRANLLGHGHPGVVKAVGDAVAAGTNFARPTAMEGERAEDLLDFVGRPEWMVKFTKNGSDANDAAIRLARAVTGRDRILFCSDQPFFSVGDWFIGTTVMGAGIPDATTELTGSFAYGDLDGLAQQLARGDVAAVFLEAARYTDPPPGFLQGIRDLCDAHCALFVLDEMITGFRWPGRTAMQAYGVEPDLAAYGKAMGNGVAVSALMGRPEFMARGGLSGSDERVFLLSYTHGAEHIGLAAAGAVMAACRAADAGTAMAQTGGDLKQRLNGIAAAEGVLDHLFVDGPGQNLIFVTHDSDGRPSQVFRALAMQEMILRGVLGPSLVLSTAHGRAEVEQTADAWAGVCRRYGQALEDGAQSFLLGGPTRQVMRRFN